MNADIFRKVSLARLSSPEQLDSMLRITTPKTWLALVALVLIIAAATVWGFEGAVATKAAGQGVVIRTGGVMNVASLGSGRLMDIRVKVGDLVNANQVVATVAQPELAEKIRMTEAEIKDTDGARIRLIAARDAALKLRLDSITRQRTTYEQQIEGLQAQRKLTVDQIPVDEELLAKGLITRQQTYQTKQTLANLDAQIGTLRSQITQLSSTQYDTENQYLQSDIDSQNRLLDLRRNLEGLKKQLDASYKVISPYSGQILEVKVTPGSLVSSAAPILSIQPNIKELEAVVYIKAKDAKGIQPDMDVELSPTNVKREEFGFIRAKVTWVAEFPATEASLMRIFQNPNLIQSIISDGPVTEVRVRMLEDPATPSGYKWSSAQGAPVKITGGMICTAQIVIREQAPASLVIPKVKETFGLS